MSNHLQVLYRHTLSKYKKYSVRYQKSIQTGLYFEYSDKKRRLILERIEKLKQRLSTLKLQIKFAIASGALALVLQASPVQGQQLGPFAANLAKNPLKAPPITALADDHPAVADIDGDGDLDVFIGTSSGSISYLRNDGTAENPYFVEQLSSDNPAGFLSLGANSTPAFADLDQDGDFDLVVGQQNQYSYYPSPNLIYYENTGTATSPVFTTPAGEHPVDNVFSDSYNSHPAFADIDNDGDLDVFVGGNRYIPSTGHSETIKFWRNDGSLPIAQYAAEDGSTNPISIVNPEFGGILDRAAPVLVDIDNDSDYDMFVGDINGEIHFFRNDGDASTPDFPAEVTGAGNPFVDISFTSNASPEFADFDNDGDLDAVVGSGPAEHLRYFENTGTSSVPDFTEREGPLNPFSGVDLGNDVAPVAADIDGDGYLDIVVGEQTSTTLFYYKNNTDGTFTEINGLANPFNALLAATDERPIPGFADFDKDGALDLFVGINVGSYQASVIYFGNDGSNNFISETSPVTTTQNYTLYAPTLGDFDGDGDYDMIIGSDNIQYSSSSFLYLSNVEGNTPPFEEQPLTDPPFNGLDFSPGVYAIARPVMVDLDHDNDMDVVVGANSASTIGGTLTFFENNGGILTQISAASDPFTSLDAGNSSHPAMLDVDNDGDLDAIAGNTVGQLMFFENQNTAPLVSTSTSLSYTENTSPFIDASLLITDADNDDILSAEVAITNFISSEDALLFTDQNGITGSYDATTGILSLTGKASLANYRTALQQVRYSNSSDNPTTTSRIVEITAVDFDNTTPDTPSSLEIIIAPVNDAPVVAATGGGITYIEDDPGAVIDAGITLSDVDNTTLASATVSIVTNFWGSEDELQFTDQNGITGNYDASTGVLTLTGTTSVVNYQIALRSITYLNSSDNPNNSTRTIAFQVNDGTEDSNAATRTAAVTPVNDAPALASSNSATNVDYDVKSGTPVVIDNSLTITDVDDVNLESAVISITGFIAGDILEFTDQSGITGTFDGTTGILSLTGTASLANYQTALQSITYVSTAASADFTDRTIAFQVNDGTDASNTTSRTVSSIVVNDAPAISSSNTGTDMEYDVTGNPVVVDNALSVSDTDDTELQSAQVIIGGFISEDILSFTDQNGITGTFDATNGTLSLTGNAILADYSAALQSITFSNPNAASGQRQIEFTVNDGFNDSAPYVRNINIGINLAPIVNTSPQTTQVGSTITIDLCDLINDPDNTYDELAISVVSITSGATTSIDNCTLTINYSEGSFSGEDQLVIQACDPSGQCDQNTVNIQVEEPSGALTIYNAVSPNGDNMNDWWEILNLTNPNKIQLFNRWGDLVKTLNNYNGNTANDELNDLPAGTYFYRINSPQGNYEGYISLKK